MRLVGQGRPQELARLPAPGTAEMRALERRLKVRFAELASEFEDEVAAGECEAPSAALAKIAAGRLKPRSFMQGRVVEALVATLGKQLPNETWEKFSSRFFSDLDDELTARGLKGPDAMVKIVQSGVPVMGKTARQPECGSMSAAQVVKVGALIDAMDLSKLTPLQREGVAEWRAWMRACEKKKQGLVIFGG